MRAELMAGVSKVLVAVGDTVAAGDTVAILESMKMEIPVVADAAGTVTAVSVAEGAVLHEGDLIVEIT